MCTLFYHLDLSKDDGKSRIVWELNAVVALISDFAVWVISLDYLCKVA